MDDARRIEALQAQIAEADGGRPADFRAWRQRTAATLRAVMGANHASVEAFDSIDYGLAMWTDSTPQSAWDRARENGVKSGIAILEGAIHEIGLGGIRPPTIDASGLHAWVAGAAAGLWDNGHHRQAVDEATRAIEVRLKPLTGSHQTGTPLVTEAFNPDPPRAGQPRLRFERYERGTPAWTDAHEGAMNFARGCMMRIRNLLEHSHDVIEPQEALECLAALSLLARWIDDAVVVTGS